MAWPARGARYIDGRSFHPLYGIWVEMVRRCTVESHPSWEHYGGRGIQVCAEWREDPWAFFEHMGDRPEGHEIDRIDNDGNYEPGNVQWATRSQQQANKRKPIACPRGHLYSETGRLNPRGSWVCIPCDREQKRESWRRNNGYYDRRIGEG